MTTAARTKTNESSHWYLSDGQPFYEVPYAGPKKGMRKATLADARKVNALPSVTTILRVLDKPALTTWLIEQAVLAVITTPRQAGEPDDAFIERVLHTEKQQDQEGEKARDLGVEIHDAIALALNRQPIPEPMMPYVAPVLIECEKLGTCMGTEQIVVGKGYAGKLDAKFVLANTTIVDFKSTKKLPKKEAYPEHVLQLAAYAGPAGAQQTANCYISTTAPGEVKMILNPPWQPDFEAFQHLLKVWQWMNGYQP